jgi:DNA-binding response OmpR family regulator
MRIILIEDDRELAETVKSELRKQFAVDVAFTGKNALAKLQSNEYDLALIDVLLPDIDGIDICRRLRQSGSKIPVLMLTGEHEVETKVAALDSGADDYLTKPFKFPELLARIRALLRRPPISHVENKLAVGDLVLDLTNQIVTRRNRIIRLRQKEIQVLEYLMRNEGIFLSRRMILEHAWESAYESSANLVEVNINSLRERIDKPFKRKLIKTVRGMGYKIDTKDEEQL